LSSPRRWLQMQLLCLYWRMCDERGMKKHCIQEVNANLHLQNASYCWTQPKSGQSLGGEGRHERM
jgi:hypothetical protein